MAQSRTSPCAEVCADLVTQQKLREVFNTLYNTTWKQRNYLYQLHTAIEKLVPDFKFSQSDLNYDDE